MNVAVATFPRLSVTLTVCAPATPAFVTVVPAGMVNTNAPVPCSVIVVGGATNSVDGEPATLPMSTAAIVAVEPKPARVAVTTVPTGPELGESVTVGVPSESVVVATLSHASVRVNAEPAVIAGRLTVAVTAPLVSVPLLSCSGFAVVAPAATVIAVPANDAASILLVYMPAAAGNPEPDTVTDAPAATVDGETVTEGAVIVNVPAITEVVPS